MFIEHDSKQTLGMDSVRIPSGRKIKSMERWGVMTGVDFLGAHIFARKIRIADLSRYDETTRDPDNLEDF